MLNIINNLMYFFNIDQLLLCYIQFGIEVTYKHQPFLWLMNKI